MSALDELAEDELRQKLLQRDYDPRFVELLVSHRDVCGDCRAIIHRALRLE